MKRDSIESSGVGVAAGGAGICDCISDDSDDIILDASAWLSCCCSDHSMFSSCAEAAV